MTETMITAGDFHWHVELNVVCPHCEGDFDACSTPDFMQQLRGAQVCQRVKACRVECPVCAKPFEFDIADGL